MADSRKTGPFSPFEWMMALRYLRARRQEGFISVISGFSLLGIALGVATLLDRRRARDRPDWADQELSDDEASTL